MLLNIRHRPGRHCASTSLAGLAGYHGLDWSEALCFGIGSGLGIWYLNFPGAGASRIVHTRSQDIELQVSDQTWDLVPEVLDGLGAAFQPRSSAMMPMPNFDYGTVVVKTLRID